ncbi:hypothetical protein llap_14124 [Limosa lapponica baueri]|uniref:Uncharacterized protein n=1 Tax=Limosa lapponica baueri TaxID=1758121 RepID=A0A2I0TPB8_LIMLA|nr:hypothetical protein llap_14124 [Limosa lapponica baueri]
MRVVKNLILISNLNLPYSSLKPLALILIVPEDSELLKSCISGEGEIKKSDLLCLGVKWAPIAAKKTGIKILLTGWHWRRVIQPMLDPNPLVEQDPSEDHKIAQAGRKIRRSIFQSPLQNMVNHEFKPSCSETDFKVSKEGGKTKGLAEDKCSKSISSTEVRFYNRKFSYKMTGRLVVAAIFESDGHSFLANCKQEMTSLYQFDLQLVHIQ